MSPIKEARSGIAMENLDEVLRAAASTKQALQTGQQQYSTPVLLCEHLNRLLPAMPDVAFDPQSAGGNTIISGMPYWTRKFGFEIDNRYRENHDVVNRVTGSCVKAWEIMDDLFPELEFECQNANPPFGLRWETSAGQKVDSTEYTWRKIMERAAPNGYGWFIANSKTIERLGLHNHERAYLYQKFPAGVWPNTVVEIGVIHWHASRQHPPCKTLVYTLQGNADEPEKARFPDLTEHASECESVREWYYSQAIKEVTAAAADEIAAAFETIKTVLDEERRKRPDSHNVWLAADGRLQCYLSTRGKLKRKLTGYEIERLFKLNDQHPLTLTVDRETRKILSELTTAGVYSIEPKALEAMKSALREVEQLSVPLMPCTDFERVAYAEEEDHLQCVADYHDPVTRCKLFTAGRAYPLTTASYSFTQEFKRQKLKYNETANAMYTDTHECKLSGMDRFIQVVDDCGVAHRFMDRPEKDRETDHDESVLWLIFQRPEVKTVAEVRAAEVEHNLVILETCEQMADYTYYPGQKMYLSRVATKNRALIGAGTGAGKSLMALSLIQIKAPDRALIIAPQGTMRASKSQDEDEESTAEQEASQWVSELRRFAPGLAVFELFGIEDYHRILKANRGTLPHGVYVTYYEAMFTNGARERCPDTWNDSRFAKECALITGEKFKLPPVPEGQSTRASGEKVLDNYWANTIGKEVNGIRCLMKPCLSTLIGHNFEFIAADEAHRAANLSAGITEMLIRLQPKYRYALTATAIPNVIDNLFALMGWLVVDDWYKGSRLNAAWPYARHELERFSSTFRSEERDYTEEKLRRAANPDYRGKVTKRSPILSSPARLLKLLKPTMAYISKRACNPNLPEPIVTEIRVPFGTEQAKLYGWFTNRGHIPHKNPLVRARVQGQYLRNICADPAGFEHGGPVVRSNFNPKTIVMLVKTGELLTKGKQVVIVCARVGQTNTIADRLTQAGIQFSRIDSTVAAEQHSYQSNRFKRGESRVMLFGMRCAAGYSFPDCPYMIIGSMEYSPGPLNQAKGRVDRVNSRWQPEIWCILHSGSIEESQFDCVATKNDASEICLQGKRVHREYVPLDAGDVMALSFLNWESKNGVTMLETDCENKWPELLAQLRKAF